MSAGSLSRRIIYVLASLLLVWAVVAFFTGGIGWMLGPLRISSRQPLRPLVIGLAIAALYLWKYPAAERATDGRWGYQWLAWALTVAVPIVAAVAFYIGVHYGSFTAGGSDSYGYLSQARLWLSGLPRVEQPWVQDFAWKDRVWTFSPLGYRPFAPDGTIVPTYPAGLPLLMAAFIRLFGDNGPFYVAPVLGALTIGFTYLLGRDTSVLLLASPAFLTHLGVIRWLALRLPVEARVPAAAIVFAAVIPFGVNTARHEGVFNVATYEGRHIRAANEVASRTPADAVVLAVQHSGSIRYYANRTTLRYDWVEDAALDGVLRDLAAKGRPVYLVVDDWEEKEFRSRFSAANRAGQLGEPIARVAGSPEVRIFEMPGGGAAHTQ
jgi:hypothetical protein